MRFSITCISLFLALSSTVATFVIENPPYLVKASTEDPQTNMILDLFEGPGSTAATFTSPPTPPTGSSHLHFYVEPDGTLRDLHNKTAFIDSNSALMWSSTPDPGCMKDRFTASLSSDGKHLLEFNGKSTLNWLVCGEHDGTQQLFLNNFNSASDPETGCTAVNIILVGHFPKQNFKCTFGFCL